MSSSDPKPGPSGSASGPSGSTPSLAERMASRKAKLRELNRLRHESRQLNHAEVVNEDRRAKEPKNIEARKRRAEYVLAEEEERARCEREGKDFDRERRRRVGADEADAQDRKRRSKINPDVGFSSFEAASARKYNSLVKQIRPDMERYERAREEAGEAFYAGAGTVVHGSHRDSKEAIERMSADVCEQQAKREKYSRRRAFDDGADIDYINERNMKFNKKLERFYGGYTKDIKDNLERGTAV